MNISVVGTLAVLALLDGAFSGFRASLGRTGLVTHRREDWRANAQGVVLSVVLLAPAITVFALDVWRTADAEAYWRGAAQLLWVLGPYAAVVLGALVVYVTLSWRKKYLATALILGPLKLARPAVVMLGIGLAMLAAGSLPATCVGILLAVGLLSVEPLAGFIWWRKSDTLLRQGR